MVAVRPRPVEVALTGEDIGAPRLRRSDGGDGRYGASVETVERTSSVTWRSARLAIAPAISRSNPTRRLRPTSGRRGADRWHDRSGHAPAEFTQPDARAYDLIRHVPRIPAVIEGSQIQDAAQRRWRCSPPSTTTRCASRHRQPAGQGVRSDRGALATGCRASGRGWAWRKATSWWWPPIRGLRPRGLGAYRHLRRPPHRHELRARRAEGRRHHHLDPDCVAKTFPAYWRVLASRGGNHARRRLTTLGSLCRVRGEGCPYKCGGGRSIDAVAIRGRSCPLRSSWQERPQPPSSSALSTRRSRLIAPV